MSEVGGGADGSLGGKMIAVEGGAGMLFLHYA